MESLTVPPQPEIDQFSPGVYTILMDPNNTSAPVLAGDGPTDCQPPIEDLKGKVFLEAVDQYGCQFLHQKLQERKPEDIKLIFSEVKDCVCNLMFHRFGSYVIQKLFEVCDEEQMNQLVSSVTANVRLLMSVCLDSQGSESMKKFLECLMTPEQIFYMMAVFSYFTVPLVNNQFGSLVIGHCFHIFAAEDTQPIFKAIANNCMEIAVNKSGSCLLLVLISKDPPWRIPCTIMRYAYDLSKDEFGNCVMQHIIGLERPGLTEDILSQLIGAFAVLSRDKYASNVVKKLMEASERKYTPQIINDIISSPKFLDVLVDPCGYSVLQTALKYSEGTIRQTLNDLICQHSELLNKK